MNKNSNKKNYVVAIIHPNGKVTKTIQAREPSLEQLQTLVSGYVERVPQFSTLAIKEENGKLFAYNRGTCYCNEEGKLPHLNLPINHFATMVWKNQYAYVDQYLNGDIVFIARTNEECTVI